MATREASSTSDHWELSISIAADRGDVVVAVTGELDSATAPRLRDVLADLVADSVPSVVLDMKRLTFIDSTGLGLLVGTRRRLMEQGGELSLVNPTASTVRVLEMTGLDRLFAVRPSA